MKIVGRVWKFGDNIDTDVIIPARFLNVSDKEILARNCFADMRPEFGDNVQKGDIIVGGSNFGCGSSREHAPLAIRASGVSVIIAKSFARIFYRNAFNIGLPIMESMDAADSIADNDTVKVDFITGKITDKNSNKVFSAKPVPGFMREIIDAGGLVEYVKKRSDKGGVYH